MVRTLLRGFTFANVCSFLALTIALGTGTAYAANTVFSTDIVDGEVKTVDLANNHVYSLDVRDDTLPNGGLTAADLAPDSVTGSELLNASLTGSDVADGTLNTSDLAVSSITGSRIAPSAVTSSDIANRAVNMDDIDGADRSGSIDVNPISSGRCTTITGNVSGAEAGDVALLTTNGTLPNGMVVYAQRALTGAVHIKVCNLTGATSAAITNLPVRVITLH